MIADCVSTATALVYYLTTLAAMLILFMLIMLSLGERR